MYLLAKTSNTANSSSSTEHITDPLGKHQMKQLTFVYLILQKWKKKKKRFSKHDSIIKCGQVKWVSDETPLFHFYGLRENKFLLYLQKKKNQTNTTNKSDKLEKPLWPREK